ncbi:OmpA family protein [Pedobacter flavus]|uniref:OmpA family protein n=1 Tax=Pedobacter flavus TaxID=3113906 RepID=A0ABU7GYH7_9SPHI|nr:OmpA family protein [Pedobacter sp. VNH31]MEE1884143.1 OmpA family protein [Pedobacter sp. VNH31]
MKFKLLKGTVIAIGAVIIGNGAFAQETNSGANPPMRTWSIGVNVGALTPLSPFGGQNDYSHRTSKLGYGLYVKKQFTNYFSLRADGYAGKLAGDNNEPYRSGAINVSPYASFETDVNYTASLNAVVNMFNIDMFKKENALQLYTSIGAGVVGYEVNTVGRAGTANTNIKTDKLTIPVGLGAKFKISDAVNFDLGWTVNFVDADDLDGYYRGANDKFNYAYAGLEFNLGKGKQLAFHNPVALTYDEAVKAKADAASANALVSTLKTDLENSKSENSKLRSDLNSLMADADGDGVSDKFDKCPGTPSGTPVDGSGCPIKLTNQITEKVIITDADRKIVDQAIKNLEFDFAKSTIRSKSYASLNQVAKLLIDKNFSLKLAGHTDNVGSDAANLKLSKDRAEAVKSYLVSQGANPSRIEATGYGKNQPIASNNTASGRQKNRRVEFTLF